MSNEIIKQNDKVSNLTGDVTITAPVQFDHLEFNGSSKWVNSAILTMAGDIVPSTDNTRSIGSQTVRFANVNARNVNAVQIGVTGTNVATNAASNPSIINGTSSSLAAGAFSNLLATGTGSFASGFAKGQSTGTATIQATASGAFARGYVTNASSATGIISATNTGASAAGYVKAFTGFTSSINANGYGSIAGGMIFGASANHNITATGWGSIAQGSIFDVNSAATGNITATGNGSMAIGHIPNGGASIIATPDNSWQFGPGTNAVAGLQVGDAQTITTSQGVLLKPTGNITAVDRITAGTSTVTNSGTGSMVLGKVNSGSGRTASLLNSAAGSFAGGNIVGTGGAGADTEISAATGSGIFAFGSISSTGTTTGTNKIQGTGQGAWVGGYIAQTQYSTASLISATGAGAFAHGRISAGGQITAVQIGAFAHGSVQSNGLIYSSGGGSFVSGGVVAGLLKANAAGAFATGYVRFRRAASSGLGSFLMGYTKATVAQSGYTINSTGTGTFAGGSTFTTGTGVNVITSGALAGSFAFGNINSTNLVAVTGAAGATGNNILSTGAGSVAFGSNGTLAISNTGSANFIQATNSGSFACGNIAVTGTGTGNSITSSGIGSVAFGAVTAVNDTATKTITASGTGSLAIGSATSAIAATVENSFQFGPGTNNTATSLQVGDITTAGVMLNGATPNFANVKRYGGGTKTLTITGIGSSAQGYLFASEGYTATMISSGAGSFAGGKVFSAIQGNGSITSSGNGSSAHGYAKYGTITSSGNGSSAHGYAADTDITASAENSFQFGPGTNATSTALQVGDITTAGIRLDGATPRIDNMIVATPVGANTITLTGIGAISSGSISSTPSSRVATWTSSGTGSFACGAINTGSGGATGNAKLIASGAGAWAGGSTTSTAFAGAGYASQIIASGTGSMAHGSVGNTSSNGTINASGTGSHVFGAVYGSGLLTAPAFGSTVMGAAVGNNSQITAADWGAFAFGFSGSGKRISAGAKGSASFGYTKGLGTSQYAITNNVSALGSFTGGYVNGSGNGLNKIQCATTSTFVFTITAATADAGDTYTNNSSTFTVVTSIVGGTTLTATRTSGINDPSGTSLVKASGNVASTTPITFSLWRKSGPGNFAFGNICSGSGAGNNITSSGFGSVAMGFLNSTTGTTTQITSSGEGSFAIGSAKNAGGIITSSGNGSFAIGNADGFAITASGTGSLAIGSATSAITATATNAVQFGPGTNATASSLQVGISSMLTSDGQVMGKALKMSTTAVSTTPFAVLQTGFSHLVTTAASTIICNLPTAATSGDGKMFTFTKVDPGAGSISIVPNGAELINGSNTPLTISSQWTSAALICNGTGWIVVFNGNMYGVSSYTSVSVSTVLTPAHSIVAVNASSGDKTITLPASIAGQKYSIKKTDSSLYIVYIVPDGLQLIDEDFNYTLELYNEFVQIVGTGTGWLVMSE